MMRTGMAAATVAVCAAMSAGAREYVVAPDGSGTNYTASAPGALRDVLRLKFRQATDFATGDRIVLKDGVYSMKGWPGLPVTNRWCFNQADARAVLEASRLTVCSASGDPAKCVIDGGGEVADTGFFVRMATRIQGLGFRNFRAVKAPGAVMRTTAGGVIVSNCVFEANRAVKGGAVSRGEFRDCVFRGNVAETDGGAMFGAYAVVGCLFEDNLALAGNAGAVAADYPWANPKCVRCTFRRNAASKSRKWMTVGEWCVATNACVIESESTKTYGRRDGGPYVNSVRVKPGDDLCAARDRLRRERNPRGSAEIVFAPGTYHVGTNVLWLDRRDDAMTLRAEKPGTVVFSGAFDFPASEFRPVAEVAPKLLPRLAEAARGRILARKLTAAELAAFVPERKDFVNGRTVVFFPFQQNPPYPYCSDNPRGSFAENLEVQPLFAVDDRLMTCARWPNRGEVVTQASTVSPDTNRCARWSWEGADIYFDYKPNGWETAKVRVRGWDAVSNRVITAGKVPHPKKVRFFFNILEELDAPGEWCVDRSEGVLCLCPDERFAKGSLCSIACLRKPFLRISDTTDVRIEGLDFARKIMEPAVLVENGERVTLEGCRFRALGHLALAISGWTNTVRSCDFTDLYLGAIDLIGGSARNLQKGNCLVENCLFERCGTVKESGDMLQLKGCGNTVRHCLIRETPHAGLNFGGPLMTMEYNRFVDTCYANGDCGALYGWGAMMSLGSVIRFNDVGGMRGGYNHGIYLDDCTSGCLVYGNVVRDCGSRNIMLGGGRNLVISNNVCIAGPEGIYCDNRGLFWPQLVKHREILASIVKQYGFTNELWMSTFPYIPHWCEDVKDTNMLAHTDNTYVNNLVVDLTGAMWSAGNLAEVKNLQGPPDRLVSSGNVYVRPSTKNFRSMKFWRIGGFTQVNAPETNRLDIGFVDLPPIHDRKKGTPWRTGDFRLKKDAWLKTAIPGWQDIPWEKVGLYEDKWRKRL